jgi:Ca2+/H+ antiporter, TMEM165/GDT1 family
LEAFFISTGVVALAEIGDKTQLLAFMLAARYKKALPIIAGILVATLLNHGLAGWAGGWLGGWLNGAVTQWLGPTTLRWLFAISFFAMAAWVLIPDKLDVNETVNTSALGLFGITLSSFFIAEMGDKTQIATVAMAAYYPSAIAVVIGTTLGMMIANVPAVLLGERLAGKIPMRWVHALAALIFAVMGVFALIAK